ncbi:ATP-binding protein [Paraburkholderia dipogonis]
MLKAQTRLAAPSPGAGPDISRTLGGEISVLSTPSSGTSITLRMPVVDAA